MFDSEEMKDNVFVYDNQDNLQVIESYKEYQNKITPVDVSEVWESNNGLSEKEMINIHEKGRVDEKDIRTERLGAVYQNEKGTIKELSKAGGKSPCTEEGEDSWSLNYLSDNIFNNLMESNSRKYINQLVTKFKYLIIKSPNAYFVIEKKDLSDKVISHLEFYVKDCKTKNEKYLKLDYLFTEVVAEIAKEAKPMLLAGFEEDTFMELRNKEINSIRSLVSLKWKLVA